MQIIYVCIFTTQGLPCHNSRCSVNARGNEQVKISWLQRTHLVTMCPCISNILCSSLISFGNLSLSGPFPGEHFIRISFMALSLISDPCPPDLLPILGPSLYLGPYLRVFLLDRLSRWFTPWWQAPILSIKNSASHARGGFGKAACLPYLTTLLQSRDCLWYLFPGVSNSASNESGIILVLDMFNRWSQDALGWFKDNLPKSSEAYCTLEVGHPREQLLFIYPAGVCHQINILKCLPARNKYLAGKRKYTGSLTGGLLGESMGCLFSKHIKNIFINHTVPPQLMFSCPFTCPVPLTPK